MCVPNMVGKDFTEKRARAYMKRLALIWNWLFIRKDNYNMDKIGNK